MRRSGHHTIFQICLIFFLSLLGVILLVGCLFILAITIQKPNGGIARSDWPKQFTENFGEQIIFHDTGPTLLQKGIERLQDNGIGIQLLDDSGREIYSYQKPQKAAAAYSSAELLELFQNNQIMQDGTTAFMGTVSNAGKEFVYILYFPMNISKVTMYLSGERFAGGKNIFLPILSVLILLALLSGIVYGLYITKAINRLIISVQEISLRSYLPVQEEGVFCDLYDNLNSLDSEIRASAQLRAQTEKMREEWIANITHDLKTPLSPIRGYAEMLEETGSKSQEQCQRYAKIMLKNVSYMESLIDDLKLTYQLENGMIPVTRKEQNLIRFLKELVIDVLNSPEYETRTIHFESTEDEVVFSFDKTLFTRAFRNLIINAFVHGDENTEISLRVYPSDTVVKIEVSDNGNGMRPELVEHLFERYYRGTSTGQKTEGSGLGLAIVKGVIELHNGTITAVSIPGVGTTFLIEFVSVKVN